MKIKTKLTLIILVLTLIPVGVNELFFVAKSNQVMGLITGIIAILFASALGFFFSGRISNPIGFVAQKLERIASGELRVEIPTKFLDSKDETGRLSIALKNISAGLEEKARVNEQIAAGNLGEEVAEKSESDILSKSMKHTISVIKDMESEIAGLTTTSLAGVFDTRGDETKFSGTYREIISGVNRIIDAMVSYIDSLPSPFMTIDTEFNIRFMNKSGCDLIGMSREHLKGKKCYDCFKTGDCQTPNCACFKSMQQNRRVVNETVAHPSGNTLDISYAGVPLHDENGKIAGCYEFVTDQTAIKTAARVTMKQAEYQDREVAKLLKNLERLANGELYCEVDIDPGDGDTNSIRENFIKINHNLESSIETIKGYIGEISRVLGDMSDGNLDVGITGEYKGDFVEIKNSLNMIIEAFNHVFGEIGSAADQVANGSKQVSDSSMSLSQGATEQASAIEELTSSLEEISDQTKLNAENANEANKIAENAKENALHGNSQMKDMLKAMDEINIASGNISKIIKVIDEIAFQTNILALNAAVEAARAGQHGKGFAVVAEEVRNLAARSANAAKETTEMIEGSIRKAEDGRKIAGQTAEALTQIVEGVTKVAKLVNDITMASNEQATGIAQVNQGIMQVSQVVQTNSATSEEGAAASQELAGQAELLKTQVSRFKLHGADGAERKDFFENKKKSAVRLIEAESNTKKGAPAKKKQNDHSRISLGDSSYGKY